MTEGAHRAGLFTSIALGLATTACFDAFRDRDCASNLDCFLDETCQEGRCDPAPRPDATADAAAPGSRTVEVRVIDRDHGTELPSATVDLDSGANAQCSCPASESLGPCRLDVPAEDTLTVCAHAPGHLPCAVSGIGPSILVVDVVLEACPEAGPCDDLPSTTCTCAGLPACGDRESMP